MSFFSKFFTKDKKETLDQGLEKTRSSVFEKITRAVAGRSTVDEEVLDDIEEALITSDVGLDTTVKIIEALEERKAQLENLAQSLSWQFFMHSTDQPATGALLDLYHALEYRR